MILSLVLFSSVVFSGPSPASLASQDALFVKRMKYSNASEKFELSRKLYWMRISQKLCEYSAERALADCRASVLRTSEGPADDLPLLSSVCASAAVGASKKSCLKEAGDYQEDFDGLIADGKKVLGDLAEPISEKDKIAVELRRETNAKLQKTTDEILRQSRVPSENSGPPGEPSGRR